MGNTNFDFFTKFVCCLLLFWLFCFLVGRQIGAWELPSRSLGAALLELGSCPPGAWELPSRSLAGALYRAASKLLAHRSCPLQGMSQEYDCLMFQTCTWVYLVQVNFLTAKTNTTKTSALGATNRDIMSPLHQGHFKCNETCNVNAMLSKGMPDDFDPDKHGFKLTHKGEFIVGVSSEYTWVGVQ